MVRSVLVFVALLAAALGLAACGSSSEEGASGGQMISIGETEFALDPSSVQVDEAGTVTFNVTNNGSIDHALEVEGQGVEEETETIAPGDTAELTVDLTDGSYELYCPVDDHRDKGMQGTVTVGAGGGGTGTGAGTGTTEDEDEGATTDGGYGY
jgi:plastocyanin